MKVVEKELPKSFEENDSDCIWLSFESFSFFKLPTLQELDWKLCGLLTKFFKKPPLTTTFLPTAKKISPAYVVVENSHKNDWDYFCRQCEGLKVKTVQLITDNREHLSSLKKHASRSDVSFPEKVVLMVAEAKV